MKQHIIDSAHEAALKDKKRLEKLKDNDPRKSEILERVGCREKRGANSLLDEQFDFREVKNDECTSW
jgi:hypothetical protein